MSRRKSSWQWDHQQDWPELRPRRRVRLPSTARIDARIMRQQERYGRYRANLLRRKQQDGTGGRTGHTRTMPTIPPAPVDGHFITYDTYEGVTAQTNGCLVLQRPYRGIERDPTGEDMDMVWLTPRESVRHPTHGPLFMIGKGAITWFPLLVTEPSTNTLIVRDATPPTPQALRFIALRRYYSPGAVISRHLWLCYVVPR